MAYGRGRLARWPDILDLFGRELLAIDCTRIKAVNNKPPIPHSTTTFDVLDQGDAVESGTAGSRVENLAEKIAALRERLIDRRSCRPI